MQEKAYYRLNELQHHHGITADEIRFLVEQKRLRLSFLLQGISLIVGTRGKQGFIGRVRQLLMLLPQWISLTHLRF
ncbi:hypothetical protein [Alteromonas macleodii]|uniref:hypothetical protein n=1 Tax=Alteromonas macleodii TaxID=28108 RepID=UPI0018DECF2A|nr:hypothetical protein [Alteromonas macleodii]MBL3810966.1 hypothetical protein [Alteromonas macleodii]MBL3884503.1 hypothetical protein [Alteromonas macleodii]